MGASEWQFKDLNRRQDEVVKISKGLVVSGDILHHSPKFKVVKHAQWFFLSIGDSGACAISCRSCLCPISL